MQEDTKRAVEIAAGFGGVDKVEEGRDRVVEALVLRGRDEDDGGGWEG